MLYGSGKYQYELVPGWAKLPKGETFSDVGDICIDGEDNVYVLNRSGHPLMVFDPEGNLVSSWDNVQFVRAHGMCFGLDGSIFCTDDGSHTVSKFTPEGRLLMTLGDRGKPSDTGFREVSDLFERIASITRAGAPFNRPTGVALSSSGEIFVSDGYGNARVHKFSPEGKLLLSWGAPGPRPGEFRLPHSVLVCKHNRVWVTDRENSRIQIFSDKGEFITQWLDLLRPTDVFIDNEIVYVCELCKRVSIFTIDGKLLSRFGNETHDISDPLFVAPHAIAVDSRGDLYVGEVAMTYAKVDRGARTIQKFVRKA